MTHKIEAIRSILPEKKDGAISSVVILPETLEFETQNPNEKVFILLRKHLATNLGWVFVSIILLIAPVILIFLFKFSGVQIPQIFLQIKQSYILGVLFAWYCIVITNSFMKFLDWYFNIYVITNERVLDFDFNPFAYHKISEAGLESIVDATQESIGFLPMIFNYGDVYIQTAGEKREFDFLSVPKPGWVRDKIMDLRTLVLNMPK